MKKEIIINIINNLENSLEEGSSLIHVVLGPREVGKTTGILNFLKKKKTDEFCYISADKVFNATAEWLREHWVFARQKNQLIVIDEIQKIENWAEVIKSLWDEDKKTK
jgi:predicted AAA+ superfamily ATPase